MSGPEVNHHYTDAADRLLLVTGLNPGDSLGREVIGLIWPAAEARPSIRSGEEYACTVVIWAAVWRDKERRAEFKQ